LPVHVVQSLASLVACSLRGEAAPFLRAKWDALRGLPGMLAKRRGVQAARRASAAEVWRALATWPAARGK